MAISRKFRISAYRELNSTTKTSARVRFNTIHIDPPLLFGKKLLHDALVNKLTHNEANNLFSLIPNASHDRPTKARSAFGGPCLWRYAKSFTHFVNWAVHSIVH